MKNKVSNVRVLVTSAMLAAIAAVLMVLEIPLPFLPSFYKFDFSELPVLIGAFAFGPIVGIVIELVKVLLNFLLNGTVTAGIGELANFLIGCSFVVPASIFYIRKKTKKSAEIGLVIGTLVCIVVGCLLNAFVLLPAYASAFHSNIDAFIGMGTEKNGLITNMFTFVIFATTPLNLIKCGVVSIITMFIYKPLSRFLKGAGKEA